MLVRVNCKAGSLVRSLWNEMLESLKGREVGRYVVFVDKVEDAVVREYTV